MQVCQIWRQGFLCCNQFVTIGQSVQFVLGTEGHCFATETEVITGISRKQQHYYQGGTICGLSSFASFLKILSSKRVCCVFRDICDKNAVNQGFWSKTAVFSLLATKMHLFADFLSPQSPLRPKKSSKIKKKNPH